MLRTSRAMTRGLGVALAAGALLLAGNALADDVPSEPPKKDSGCGCETSSSSHTYGALSLAFMGVGLVLFRRSLKQKVG